jgi:carboxypeptidase Taq
MTEPASRVDDPAAAACSFCLHESQSRFVENVIGRSPEFWSYYLPELKSLAPELAALDYRGAVQGVNVVKPSKIRVEADEATYAMHIIIRFEIERDLFADKLRVDELPQVWDEKYSKYLGVDIKDDAEGVLQDVHWSQGYFGYFPSYAIGNIICGQLHAKLEKECLNGEQVRNELLGVREWLNRNVHSHGNLHNPLDLLRIITGEGLEPRHFASYLNSKYERVYGL